MADGYTTRDVLPEGKRPLYRPLPDAEPFPLEALGALRPAAEAIHALTQAPEAMCAQSALGAATLAAQPLANVELPGAAGIKPLTCYFVTIGETGERKSAVDRLALRPIREKEAFLSERAEQERADYAADKRAWDAAVKAAEKAGKGNRATVREALRAIGPEPQPPPSPMMLIADPTPEGLERHLSQGRPWGGVFTAEGGVLIGGHGFKDDARMRFGGLLNSLWDGEPIRRARAGGGSVYLPGRRCALHVMMQPVAAEVLLADPMLAGLGLHARMLLSSPVSTAGSRMFRDAPADAKAAHHDYCHKIRHLLDVPPALEDGALKPPAMTLHPEARALWIAFHDHAEKQLGEGGAYREVRGFGAKLAEHAGRLAAVLAIYEHGGGQSLPEVSGEHMACGISLAEHYAGEMLRLAGGAAVSAELRVAQKVLDWLARRGGGCVHLAEVYQFGPVRDATSARAAMVLLEDHQHVRALKPGTLVEGVARREAWEVVR